jgi:amino acid permease
MNKQILAIATFSGTIIGVGLFGLPYAAAQIGFWPMILYLGVLTILMTLIHLMYGEIVLRTNGQHRLPGFAKIYIGSWVAKIAYLTAIIGFIGSLLAYVLVGGAFLGNLLIPLLGGSPLLYIGLYYLAGITLIGIGSRAISKTEFFSFILFFAVFAWLCVKALPLIAIQNYLTVDLSLASLILPYGIILFSLSGASMVPEVAELLGTKKLLKKIIIIGTLIPAITYAAFITLIVGVTGDATTQEGMTGLIQAIGNHTSSYAYIFGVITTFTSFITIGISLKKVLQYDWGLPSRTSWAMTCLPIAGLYAIGITSFIDIIGFVGGVMLGIDSLIITAIYILAKRKPQRQPEYNLPVSIDHVFLIMLLFMIGVILEMVV